MKRCLPILVIAPLTGALSAEEPDLFTGEGVSLGGVLFPHFHAASSLAASTSDAIADLATGHHDPQRDVTLQSLEPGVSLRLGLLEGFATYSATSDESGSVDGELEEAFLKLVDLPGDFELRGGRFLNRFGFQNASHSHAWNQVNNTLLNGSILQEGELLTDGAEISWRLPTPFLSSLSLSYGNAPAHEGHAHEEHGHEEEEHEEEEHEEHGHEDGEAPFEAEGARFVDTFFSAHSISRFDYNDFHQHSATVSFATGENESGGNTRLYGVGYEYVFRENGYSPGGRVLRWRNEVAYRRFEATAGESGKKKTLDDLGVYSALDLTFNDHLAAGLRLGYITGVDESELESRFRVSPTLTLAANRQRTIFSRLQYDYDHFDNAAEHTLFLQFGLNWGGPEIR